MSTHRKTMATLAVTITALTGLAACGTNEQPTTEDTVEYAAPTANFDLEATPAETTWQSGPAGLSFPVSDVSGAEALTPVPHGFSADPQGAVIAAITTQVFMSGADDDSWPQVSQTLLEPGPGRDQWAQARALMTVTGEVENPPEFVGFRVEDFAPDASRAVITLAVAYSPELTAALPVQLSRASGDWRVVLPTQDQAPDLTEISSADLDGFVAFGPAT